MAVRKWLDASLGKRMTKELLAILGLTLTLLTSVFYSGMRIGALTERADTLSKQLDLLQADVKAMNGHLIAWISSHEQSK